MIFKSIDNVEVKHIKENETDYLAMVITGIADNEDNGSIKIEIPRIMLNDMKLSDRKLAFNLGFISNGDLYTIDFMD